MPSSYGAGSVTSAADSASCTCEPVTETKEVTVTKYMTEQITEAVKVNKTVNVQVQVSKKVKVNVTESTSTPKFFGSENDILVLHHYAF